MPLPLLGGQSVSPLGSWLVNPDEMMIYKTSCSGSMLLMLGDVVTTGTPLGVGLGMKPPVFLKAEMSSNLALMALANSAKS